jgi:hypothetical protein
LMACEGRMGGRFDKSLTGALQASPRPVALALRGSG